MNLAIYLHFTWKAWIGDAGCEEVETSGESVGVEGGSIRGLVGGSNEGGGDGCLGGWIDDPGDCVRL